MADIVPKTGYKIVFRAYSNIRRSSRLGRCPPCRTLAPGGSEGVVRQRGTNGASPLHNWSLWGRIFQAARSSLAIGIERAKCLIAICAAERGAMPAGDAFEISLNVLEGTE